jgi:phosphoglycolate phosphatase-like HAD superfamily hydrolase
VAVSGKIALVFDCDGTIAEDTTTRVLRAVGIAPNSFWRQVRRLEQEGWDAPLAYMHLLIKQSEANQSQKITRQTFIDVGKRIQFSKGIPRFFKDIRKHVRDNYGKYGITLGIFVISSGFEEVIRASRLASLVDDIFGCRFSYQGRNNAISFPKASVTFTEKTKFMFAINKGVSSADLCKDPYAVNDYILPTDRVVPLQNMIYIGDGPTDVACMSLLKKEGCEIFAVYTPPRQGVPKSTHELARQGRFTRGPFTRDYSPRSDLRRALESEIDGYAQRIHGEIAAKRKRAVRH